MWKMLCENQNDEKVCIYTLIISNTWHIGLHYADAAFLPALYLLFVKGNELVPEIGSHIYP